MKNITGFGDTRFWIGVVEDRNDPMKMGRVRVRIFGIHSDKLVLDEKSGEGIPVDGLPWAHPIMPITSASMNGIGDAPIGPVEGTWVFGVSLDGDKFQMLAYLGTLPGNPDTEPQQSGFFDTEGGIKAADRPKRPDDQVEKYPKKAYLNEPDTNRLARNEKISQTIVDKKKKSVDTNVSTSTGQTWNEPQTPYAAKYPFNHVKESESGHVIEIDDTPNAERLHTYHRSGTFEEIHPDGTKVEKVVKDNYEIVLGNDYVHIKGTVNVTIDGNANIYTKGNVTQKVDGNVTETVAGNVTRNVGGTYTVQSGGNMTFIAPNIHLNP
ncbi:MAG: hypothetical protein D6732_03520 [Methanobacteriota archaeon]|nr:MAG: hypothetical protein D6732_03520 [Euryarchaeota archaeon]